MEGNVLIMVKKTSFFNLALFGEEFPTPPKKIDSKNYNVYNIQQQQQPCKQTTNQIYVQHA